jgi:hypothetical protein
MPAHISRADKSGLQDKECDLTGKCDGMKPQKDGPRNGGMEQVVVDGVAEAPRDHRGDQQRHGKIETPVHQLVSAEYRVRV